MPRKNVEKKLIENGYYHVFNKGVAKRSIFKGKDDFEYFELLLLRYLNQDITRDKYEREYPLYRAELDVISYCLTPKSLHLLVRQHEDKNALPKLMRSLSNSYTSYFNKVHRRSGPVFEGTYKASLIDNHEFLVHVSRHIHLQTDKYTRWPYSSLPYYLGQKQAIWMNVHLMQEVFDKNPSSYIAFLADKESYESSLKYISGILADK